MVIPNSWVVMTFLGCSDGSLGRFLVLIQVLHSRCFSVVVDKMVLLQCSKGRSVERYNAVVLNKV